MNERKNPLQTNAGDKQKIEGNEIIRNTSVADQEKLKWKKQIMRPMWSNFRAETAKNKSVVLEKIIGELTISTRDPRVLKEIQTFHQKFEEIKTQKDLNTLDPELEQLGKNIENFYDNKENF